MGCPVRLDEAAVRSFHRNSRAVPSTVGAVGLWVGCYRQAWRIALICSSSSDELARGSPLKEIVFRKCALLLLMPCLVGLAFTVTGIEKGHADHYP
jgi:hypothetical protein